MLSWLIDSATWAVCRTQMEEVDQTSCTSLESPPRSTMGSPSRMWTQKKAMYFTHPSLQIGNINPARVSVSGYPAVDEYEKPAGVPHAMSTSNPGHWVARQGSQLDGDWSLLLVSDIINTRRSALFRHMVSLGVRTPAHREVQLAIHARCRCPHPHPGGNLAVGCVTHSSSRWCTLVHTLFRTLGTYMRQINNNCYFGVCGPLQYAQSKLLA